VPWLLSVCMSIIIIIIIAIFTIIDIIITTNNAVCCNRDVVVCSWECFRMICPYINTLMNWFTYDYDYKWSTDRSINLWWLISCIPPPFLPPSLIWWNYSWQIYHLSRSHI
jgi:hypothetical protein